MRYVLSLVLLARIAAAVVLTGKVVDETGARVPKAVGAVRAADQTTIATFETANDGTFRIELPREGAFSVTVTRSGFSPTRAAVLVGAKPAELVVRLNVQPVGTQVTVTAEANRVSEAASVPQRVNVIQDAAIEQRARTVAADLFREEVGVDVQRTAPAMGGLTVRGLLGRNVAVYRDGVRYTTSAQRGGVSTFWNLTEASNLDSAEVLRGPNSAQYSSDSLGGTVHFISRSVSPTSSQGVHGEFAPLYYSAAHTFGGNSLTTFGGTRFGATVNLSARRVNTMRAGGGVDTHAAVTRFLGLPSTVFGERLPGTALTQYGGMVHLQYATSGRGRLTAHYERSQQDGAKRYDQLLGGDGNLIADLRNLMLDLGYLRYTHFGAGPFDEAAVTASYNAQREERVNQGGQGNPLAAITHQYERTRAWGTSFHLSRNAASHSLLFGGDGYHERVRSPAFTFNPANGSTVASRPRIPDGARYLLYGLYAQDVWEPLRSGRLRLSGAVRFGGASYQSRRGALWPGDSLAANAVTGRVGATVRIVEPLRAYLNYSRGFRAPGITDLGTLGIQGNGFYEASFAALAGRSGIVGDRAGDRAASSGRAVAQLRPETSDNFEGGVNLQRRSVRASAGAFRMNLRDSIVSQTLLLPAGAVGQPLGDQVITSQLASGAVFVPAAVNPVLVRANLGGANVFGVEHELETSLPGSLLFGENVTWIRAEDIRTALPPDIEGGIPPLTANLRLRWAPKAKRYWVELYSTLAGRQDRLSSLALADRRTGATRSRTNIANFFHNGARVRGLVSNGVLLPTGESLEAVQNRVLGSAASAPLFAAVPGYGVHGVRGGYQLSERSHVFADFSNVFDRSHRGVSWGIDGAGRAVTIRYRYSF